VGIEMMSKPKNTADSRPTESTTAPEKLLTFRQVGERLGLACKTSHSARAFAARGQNVAVRINERVVRFTESSVNALASGRVDPVAAKRRSTPDDTSAPITSPAEALVAGEVAKWAPPPHPHRGQKEAPERGKLPGPNRT